MDLGLQDQVAVIIGAASGIGLAIAKEFMTEEARVCAVDIDSRIEAIISEVANDRSAMSCGICADATDQQRMQSIADEVVSRFGRCDHVVVAAGCGSGKFGFPYWNLQPSDWTRVLEVNLMSVVNVAHAYGPKMAEAGRGTMCFISSVAGQIGSPTDPPYSAAKAGVINFGQCAARDLASFGVRVNMIAPGMVATPMNRSVWQAWRTASPDNQLTYEEWGSQKCQTVAPLGRWQEASEIAAVVAFLASDRARNITGQTINVDGGQRMHS
jgi:NAD(P)-dependent dehydrogenase (short-subunit alcohol dehydrogenase family)